MVIETKREGRKVGGKEKKNEKEMKERKKR